MKQIIILITFALTGAVFAQQPNIKIRNTPSEAVPVSIQSGVAGSTAKGAATYANGQVTTSITAATLVAARATRRSVTITNNDAAIIVYIGNATVTAANGYILKAAQTVTVDSTALIQVIAASGTPIVSYIETYD